ncbi:MAG TPA: acyl-CoA dehydratase activase-related protein [Candidatus Nanopelagicaceae bacterium]|nr:acyl-CoA dehydratase activase-related protein [Candidatus Nanopelagicaceae bacterium]
MEVPQQSTKTKIKVGIPRALHFYRYFPFWKKILEELGAEIVISPLTNKKIVEVGVTHGFGELCIPVKIYYGQVLKLVSEHPDLDYVFVPRYVSEVKDSYFCPKFLSLPDVIKILPDIPKILNFEVNVKEFPISTAAIELGRQLGKNQNQALNAYREAQKYFDEYHEFLRQGASVNYALRLVERNRPFTLPKRKSTGDIRFLLLGHGYNIFDTFINLDFQKKLIAQGAEVLTIENLPEYIFKKPVIVNPRGGKLRNYWRHEEEIMQGIRYFLTEGRDEIDGVIFLISFACGPDSLISELIMRDMKVVGLPFLEIIMDEHSGEAGLLTRIESFTEMIKRKKRTQAGKKKAKIDVQ